MLTESDPHAASLERLSALMDGELDDGGVVRACSQWRENAESRSAWHAYHLIGDVLRADDLACDPARDVAFLQAFRGRLADEPVVLAPRSLEPGVPGAWPATKHVVNGARSNRWSWMAPTALAAGFFAVGGVVMLTHAPGTLPDRQGGPSLAQTVPAASVSAQVPMPTASALTTPIPGEAQTFVASGKLIRDARLDRYLDAHQQFAGSSALGVPSAFLRRATTANAGDR